MLAGWLLASCSSGYSLAGVEGGRVAITDVYDRKPDAEALNILKPYQQKVDSIMSPIIGHSAKNLTAYRPESPLSNLMADVLRQAAVRAIGKPADVAVMNMGVSGMQCLKVKLPLERCMRLLRLRMPCVC